MKFAGMNSFSPILLVVLAIMANAIAQPPSAASVPALPSPDVNVKLQELTPSLPAPPAGALLPVGEDVGPVCLLGIDLIQNATPASGEQPRLDGNLPLELVAYWIPRTPLTGRIPFAVHFWSGNYMISRNEDFAVGPATGEPPWEPGAVYKKNFPVNLPLTATAITGDSFLSIHLGAAGGESAALEQVRLQILPRIGPGRVAQSLLGPRLGPEAELLSKSFRLGQGASVTIPVGDRSRPILGIAVISAYSYGTVPQDQPVAEVLLKTGMENKRLSLLSGLHTSASDYDFFKADMMNHRRSEIIESTDADYLNPAGAPFRRHKYVGVLPLDTPAPAIESIAFRPTANVVVDVYEIALLYALPVANALGNPLK